MWLSPVQFGQRCGYSSAAVRHWIREDQCPPIGGPLTVRRTQHGTRQWYEIHEDDLAKFASLSVEEFSEATRLSIAYVYSGCREALPWLGRKIERVSKRPLRIPRTEVAVVLAAIAATPPGGEWLHPAEFAHRVGHADSYVRKMIYLGCRTLGGRMLRTTDGGFEDGPYRRFNPKLRFVHVEEVSHVLDAKQPKNGRCISLAEFARRCRIEVSRAREWLPDENGLGRSPWGPPLRAELRPGIDDHGRPRKALWFVHFSQVAVATRHLVAEARKLLPDDTEVDSTEFEGVNQVLLDHLRATIKDNPGKSRNGIVAAAGGNRQVAFRGMDVLALIGEWTNPPSVQDLVRAAFERFGDAATVRKVAKAAGCSKNTAAPILRELRDEARPKAVPKR